jgi:hypothetical protein
MPPARQIRFDVVLTGGARCRMVATGLAEEKRYGEVRFDKTRRWSGRCGSVVSGVVWKGVV